MTPPTSTHAPYCFVLMPFGDKPDPAGGPPIPFDRIYEVAIRPAVEAAGLIPVRADEERLSGIIHKAMFERLLLCEYAVADLTTSNANVFYELGVRHAARPRTTVAIHAQGQPIPFDVTFLRSIPYGLGAGNGFPDDQANALRETLTERLAALRQQHKDAPVDSPLFQLLGDWRPGDIARLKTDVFRDRAVVNEVSSARLSAARRAGKAGLAAMQEVEASLGHLDLEEAAVIIDLLLSYRAISACTAMVDLIARMPGELARQPMVREQLAFALNRRAGQPEHAGDRERARELLEELIAERGPSSESCGLLGRIYKDEWLQHRNERPRLAAGHLQQAIDAYRRGFEADNRDAYPGINAVTLLDVRGDDEALRERDRLVPVVRYAVERRLGAKAPDYWDHATMLELAVLGGDQAAADRHASLALACVRERWEPETTARNLAMIREARRDRGDTQVWLDAIITDLEHAAAEPNKRT